MYPQPKRPLGITLLAIPFIWIGCSGALILPLMSLAGVGAIFRKLLTPYLFHSTALAVAASSLLLLLWLGAYILYAFLGYGLWKLRPWALKGAVIVHVFGIVIGLIAVIILLKYEPLMALPIGIGTISPFAGILWYLKRPNVRAAFGMPVPTPPIATVPRKPLKPWVMVTIALSACAILLVTFVFGLLFAIDKTFRQSDIYNMSLDRARNSPCVVAKLGTPIVAKGTIEGNLNTQGSEGTADMSIPMHGPKGSGSLEVSGKKVDNRWEIDSLTLLDDEGQIHLLPVSSCP
jgi:hypothetical protein